MKSRNFAFLREVHPDLERYAALAEHHLGSDPASSLVKLRMAIEYLVDQLYQRRSLPQPRSQRGGDPDLCDQLTSRAFVEAVPKPVVDALHRIRINGKRGAHHGYATDQEVALASLQTLHDAVRWFFMTLDSGSEPPPFDSTGLVREAETRRTLKRERESALREKARLTGEVRELRDELAAARDAAARSNAERRLGERVATLLDIHELPGATEAQKQDAEEELSAVCQRLVDQISKQVSGIVPPVTSDGRDVYSALQEALMDGQHVALVGLSGIGKTHAVLHLAQRLAGMGILPIVARARYFNGQLDEWLDRAVAASSKHTSATLFHMAAALGRRPLVIVDGLNECPQQHRDALTDALQAIVLRESASILVTSQTQPGLPFVVKDVALRPYSQAQKESIFSMYAPERAVDSGLARALSTPFEVALAARCAADIGSRSSTYDIFAAYVRAATPAAHRDATFRLLLDLAHQLVQRLRFSLPVASLHRLAEMADPMGSPETLAQELLGGSILHVEEGLVSFRHELFQDFFVAELLLRRHGATGPAELADELSLPRYQGAALFVAQAAAAEGSLVPLLKASENVRCMLPGMMRGRLGLEVQELVTEEIRRVVAEAEATLDTVAIEVQELPVASPSSEDDEKPTRVAVFAQPRAWTSYEEAVLRALGDNAHAPSALALVRRLVEATDHVVERAHREHGIPRGLAYHELYGIYHVGTHMPASVIVDGARNLDRESRGSQYDAALQLAEEAECLTPGMLFIACLMVRNVLIASEMGRAGQQLERLTRAVPKLLERAWKGGFYHVRLVVLELVTWVVGRSRSEETLGGLRELMGGFDTRGNLFLNTALVEALDSLGMVDAPYSADVVQKEIEALLAHPYDPDARRRAYYVYSHQLEDVIGGAHIEAISGLDPRSRLRLNSMAALGMDDLSFATKMCLRDVIEHPHLDAEPLAVEAIEMWSSRAPSDQETFPDEVVGAFRLATIGRAWLGLGPCPCRDGSALGTRAAIWFAWAEILYWTALPNVGADERGDGAKNAWAYILANATAAVSPLYFLDKQERFDAAVGRRGGWFDLRVAWPAMVQKLFKSVAGKLDELTPAFGYQLDDERRFVIDSWAKLPRPRARAALAPLADRADVGAYVVVALRALDAGQ